MRLYRILLLVYPRDFRRRYGAEMLADFERLLARTRGEQGAMGLARMWLLTACDTLVSGLRERFDGSPPHRRIDDDEAGRGAVFEAILDDVKLALRVLGKAPGFAAVAVVTLGVAIGANAAIFSVVDGVLLRPLPYPDAEEIVAVTIDASPVGTPEARFSAPGYWHFREKNRSFEDIGAFRRRRLALTGDGEPTQVSVGLMTNSMYQVLGVAPLQGRLPSAEADRPDGPLVAVLSHPLWVTRFGSDPDVIGRTIELDDRSREVVGIMPPGFGFPDNEIDLWVPRQLDPASEMFMVHGESVVARLRDEATLASATTDAESLIQRFGEAGYGPQWLGEVFSGRAGVQTLKESIVGDARRPLLIVLGMLAFVLLIACANVANLFLVRAEGRVRETAVRAAIGAKRSRLIQYVLTECMLVAVIGGIAGLLLAYLGIGALAAIGPESIPRLDGVVMDRTVLFFTAGVSVVAGLLFGVLPTLQTHSSKVRMSLSDGRRGSTSGRDRVRARGILVVTEVALALVAVIGAGLMVRTFQELRSVDPGFDASGVVTFELSLPPARYPDADATTRFFDELLESVRALPGVTSAGAATGLPLTGSDNSLASRIEEFPTPEGEFPPVFVLRWVTPGYFETMRIPIENGRTVEARDHEQRLGTLFISAALKERYWPNTSAMGKRILADVSWGEVAGVVGDVHTAGLNAAPPQTIYLPVRDTLDIPRRVMNVVVRTSEDPSGLVPLLRREVGEMDPALPLSDIGTMEEVVGASLSRTSFTMFLLVLAAAVAVFLGSIGIYGVIAYVVSQRTGELGVRMALGADSPSIRSMVLREGMTLAVTGVALGLAGAALMTRTLTTLLFGVSPFDSVTFIGGPVLFLLVAALACFVPARRASRVDPAVALRSR